MYNSKEKRNEYQRKWYIKNKDKVDGYHKRNKENHKLYQEKWNENNKERIKGYGTKYCLSYKRGAIRR
jgi:hypothetical protein